MKYRVQNYVLFILIIFTIVSGALINKIALSQTDASKIYIIGATNSKKKYQKGICKCLKRKLKLVCRKKNNERGSSKDINIISPSIEPFSIGYLIDSKGLSFSWSKVPGATNYYVRLKKSTTRIWYSEPIKNIIDYPNDKPPLEKNVLYELVIEATVNEEPIEDKIYFQIISQGELNQIEAEEQKIIGLKLNNEDEAIKLSRLYSEKKLFTDAIEILKKNNRTASILLELGSHYIEVGQPSLAKNYYKQAFNNSSTLNHKAEAQLGLGLTNAEQGKSQQAIKWLKKAYESYKKLGKQDISSLIAERLEELQEDNRNKN